MNMHIIYVCVCCVRCLTERLAILKNTSTTCFAQFALDFFLRCSCRHPRPPTPPCSLSSRQMRHLSCVFSANRLL